MLDRAWGTSNVWPDDGPSDLQKLMNDDIVESVEAEIQLSGDTWGKYL